MPRVLERILGRKKPEPQLVIDLLGLVLDNPKHDSAAVGQCLAGLAAKIQTGEVPSVELPLLGKKLLPVLRPLIGKKDVPLAVDAALLAATLKDPAGLKMARNVLETAGAEPQRLRALDALVAARDADLLKVLAPVLVDAKTSSGNFRGQVLTALGRLDDPTGCRSGAGRLCPTWSRTCSPEPSSC